MIAVGIDISKSKSKAAILNGDGTVRAKPFDVHHTKSELNALINYIEDTGEQPKILLEPTSHYHYPVLKALQDAGFPICLINPYQMKKYGDIELRKAKTDKKDALRIAKYALEKSYLLTPRIPFAFRWLCAVDSSGAACPCVPLSCVGPPVLPG